MTAQELFQYLTEGAGLDEATTKVIMDQVAKNEKVAGRAANFTQRSEYDSLATRAAALEKAATQAKVYEDWYGKNFAAIEALQKEALMYKERYGSLEDPTKGATPPAKPAIDEAAVLAAIDKRINEAYNPRWSAVVTGAGSVIEKHLRAKRDKEIDWAEVSKLAEGYGGDLNKAYEEWDKPEREKATKASMDSEVERRVKEGIAKAQTASFFPAGAEGSASSGGPAGLTKSQPKKEYNRDAVIQAAVTGKYEGAVVQ